MRQKEINKKIIFIAMAVLIVLVFTVAKAQENDNQDGFNQIYQFYKKKIILPEYSKNDFEFGKRPNSALKPKAIEIKNNGDLFLPPPTPSFLSKVFSPIFKSAGEIKDGYLSMGDKIFGLIDLQSYNLPAEEAGLSAVVAIQDQHPFLLSFDVPPVQNSGTQTSTPDKNAAGGSAGASS
mgnify:CR=1 FL=1